MGDASRLKEGLRTEVLRAGIERAASGATPLSAVLLLRDDELPWVLVTDSRGVAHPRVISYVDLLATLDGSSVIEQLAGEAVRRTSLPPLPEGCLLVDTSERLSGRTLTVTGTLPAASHLFVLEQEGETTTHPIPLPRIAYRAVWVEETRSVANLSVALCSPDLRGRPTEETEIYRWAFSNVYDKFSDVLEGVCWPGLRSVRCDLSEVPRAAVLAFVGIPNDADRYAQDISPNAPTATYKTFLETIEERGGLDHDWLVPCAMSLRDLHRQKRRKD